MRSWRKTTWLILFVQVIFIIWIIVGVASASDNCAGVDADYLDACQAGTAVGAGIGVGLIIVLWAMVDVILGVIWLVTGRNRRNCPACGRGAKQGITLCTGCGHDFARAARG